MAGHYVWCRFCGKSLTDESSTAVGYGPDCAVEQGLPHGAVPPARGGPGDGQGALFTGLGDVR